jgi:hypothetical protein
MRQHLVRSLAVTCSIWPIDFNLPTNIAWIIVVQNLSRLEDDASLPLWVGVKLSCLAKAGHSILINEPVVSRVK